jgi:tripartite-type tricarboxylate transporter receptor subunit TctC
MSFIRRRRLLVTALAAAANWPHAAPAQTTFPAKPVRIVVPFPPGGAGDLIARVFASALEPRWGQPVLVDNRPGAGTVIGSALVAKAPPDGLTLLLMANSFVINAKMRAATLPYDGLRAFAPVALLVDSPQVIVVNSASPYRTFKDWLDAARAQPGTLSYASVGPATTQHIAGEMLQRAAGVRLLYTPYPGNAPAVAALLGSHVSAVMGNWSEVQAQIDAGKLRPLAVTTPERLDTLKQVPTVAESYPGYSVTAWFGLCAPAGTPRETIEAIADAVAAAMKTPDVQARLAAAGLRPGFLGPAAMASHLRQAYEQYAKVIDEAKLTLE